MNISEMAYIVETEKRVPVAYDVDVVIAGGGISGVFAALAAARTGVSVLLVERSGILGGNIGAGYIIGGDATGETKLSLDHELPSIPKELFSRLEKLECRKQKKYNYAEAANMFSYLSLKMSEEAGVELVLSAYASDPIMDEGKVRGIFIEGKSGRVAAKAKIVIDATGDASIAQRAGADIIRNVSKDYSSYGNLIRNSTGDFELYDESGLFMMIGNVDNEKYRRFIEESNEITVEERAWAEENIKGPKVDVFGDPFVPYMKKAWESGEFRAVKELDDPNITISSNRKIGPYGGDNFGGRGAIAAGQIDMGDMRCISVLEKELRIHAFETVQFLKKYIPGFENAYLMFTSPFIGSRGGPCIEGEHVLTVEETATGARFRDVMFQNFRVKPSIYEDWVKTGCDVPYSMMLPKGIDDMMVIGRGASYIQRGHDGAGMMRTRPIMMALGQAAGMAAAMCIKDNKTPMTLDIKRLQMALLKEGFNIGNTERLRELGLIV